MMRVSLRRTFAFLVALSVGPRIAVAERRYVPAFDLEEITFTRTWGQFRLSPGGELAVFTGVGRYFGHPLFPDFGPDNNLRIVSVRTGEILQLTSGTRPKTYPRFSPDGRRVAFESEGDIWSVDVESGGTRRLTGHLARDHSASWSPDGSRIAFVSSRSGRSEIHVMSAEGEWSGIEQVTSNQYRENLPTWSPDGNFILYTSPRRTYFNARGIYRVPLNGRGETELTPADDAHNNLPVFSPDGGRVAYVSDRSGYLNLWVMDADGGDHRQLSRASEDQYYPDNDHIQTMGPHWSPDGTRLLHFSNRLGNLALMVVEVKEGKSEIVEGGEGSHHPVGWVDDDTVAFVDESYRRPPDLHVKGLGGAARQLTFSSHSRYPRENFDRLESVSWRSDDGVTVHGYMRTPSNIQTGERLPAIVMSHTYNLGQFYNQWNPIFSYIVQSGYVMLMVDHRGSNGYGKEFRDLVKGDWGFAQLKDIVSAASFLKARPEVDGERLGIMGYSMGGYMTLLALTTRPEVFRAGVSIFGLGEMMGDRVSRVGSDYFWAMGGTEEEIPDAYRKHSPITYVDGMRAPVLLIHSDGDPIEPVTKTHNFVAAMEKAGKEYQVKVYRNEAHGLARLENQLDSFELVLDFLERNLSRAALPIREAVFD